MKGDGGFAPELGDEHLYTELWGRKPGGGPYSTQVGHLLTAIHMGMNGADFFKGLVVGHEQVGDQVSDALYWQSRSPTQRDIEAFNTALENDRLGDFASRDAALASIFDPSLHGPQAAREGNSMEDLRLSVRGWDLGLQVATGAISSKHQLEYFILTKIMER
jgi:hypothetical protein